jgi:hypothetical protein
LTFLSCTHNVTKGESNNKLGSHSIEPFEATILNSDYSMAYSVLTILTKNELKIVFKGGLVGEKDSVLFSNSLQPSDTLQQISNINLDSLKEYYSNDCISDGSQVTVTFKKNGKEKSIHLSNFYQDDVGKIIYLINSLVADKYKIWYDKEKLIADYKRCNGN